ncbi:MAG: diguanylate cyclase [Rhodocyclales bacterium GT-UBC]|nr:MAG: diguanylate cyclase [Rhodocyclales bacterium GT-UBC]
MSLSSHLHPISLSFRDPALEARYLANSLPALRRHSRLAILVGLVLYELSSLLDSWYAPDALLGTVTLLRWMAMGPAILTLLYTFTPAFERCNSIPLALVGAYAAAGIFALLWLGPETLAIYYNAALVLVILFTYTFVGARFIHALGINLLLIILYNLIFLGLHGYPPRLMLTHDFFILCANVIGGFDCYLSEAQRRMLFFREQELDQERRHHLERSLHDRLTGLPNRELLHDRLEQALNRAERYAQAGVGIFIDLDNFKPINDSRGHEAGDRVLQTVARRLRAVVRDSDTVARLGGDEFFVVANQVTDQAAIDALTQALIDALAQPVDLSDAGQIPVVQASLGYCAFPFPGATPGDIIRRADQAMYAVKRAGGGGAAAGLPANEIPSLSAA